MPRLLLVHHSKTGGAAAMAAAVLEGASDPQIDDVEVVTVDALAATPDDVLGADGYVLGTPENFGYMSGAMKHFLDTIFYPCENLTKGRPYALFVKSGNDGTGAVTAVERIVAGLDWRQVVPPVMAVGDLTDDHLSACRELGMTIAAGMDLGIY